MRLGQKWKARWTTHSSKIPHKSRKLKKKKHLSQQPLFLEKTVRAAIYLALIFVRGITSSIFFSSPLYGSTRPRGLFPWLPLTPPIKKRTGLASKIEIYPKKKIPRPFLMIWMMRERWLFEEGLFFSIYVQTYTNLFVSPPSNVLICPVIPSSVHSYLFPLHSRIHLFVPFE